MSTTANPAPTSPAAGFASLLSALINPQPAAKAEPEWNDEELAEDIATLSYESALRSHSRYSTPKVEQEILDSLESEPMVSATVMQSTATEASVPVSAPAAAPASADPEPSHRIFRPFERHRKNASITIRMSKEECDQLHQRADEAGMTVSAYLRSCTFEAENLRAQVKETLAQLRQVAVPEPTTADWRVREHRSWRERLGMGWLMRLFSHPQAGQRVARA